MAWFFPGHDLRPLEQHTVNSSSSVLLQSTTTKVFVLCLLLPIPIFAVLGNLLILTLAARLRKLQTPTDAFMLSLAMADFLVAVLVMPFSLVRSIDTWHFGSRFCQVHFLLDITFCTSSIFNLSCVALDRYIAVCDPLRYLARMSPTQVTTLLLLCRLLSLVISSLCVSFGMHPQSPPAGISSTAQQENQTCLATFYTPYALVSSTVCFFIPVGFMLFAYGKIFLAAQRQARWIHAMEQIAGKLQSGQSSVGNNHTEEGRATVEKSSMKKARKAAKKLGLIMGVFVICWLPFFCMNMIHPLWGYTISPLALEVSMWLGYANSSLNPFLYASINRSYRHSFVAILGCAILGRQLRSCLEYLPSGGQIHTLVTLETISR
ncbi:5-hydroxytryptamine receptor 4-like [Lampris incognitus]|uniref:5-hydroxytryptamine receptor 4-like n=1 Tax=Lampris incognitus TaxID=2546036 RepID=UPI0024B58127|nr:5-hydroxytryptamine receptor 4-like [Lampris incognitus]